MRAHRRLQFAEKNGVKYIVLDPPAPTEPPTEPVKETSPTVEPTQPATEAPTVASTELGGFYLGDVDNNGSVEVIDATFIQRNLANLEIPDGCDITHGDIDRNRNTRVDDVTYLMRWLSGIRVEYPVGEWGNL